MLDSTVGCTGGITHLDVNCVHLGHTHLPLVLLSVLHVRWVRSILILEVRHCHLALPVGQGITVPPTVRALAHLVQLVSITRIPAVPAYLHVLHVRPGLTAPQLALVRVRLAPRGTTAPPLARLHVRPVLLGLTSRTQAHFLVPLAPADITAVQARLLVRNVPLVLTVLGMETSLIVLPVPQEHMYQAVYASLVLLASTTRVPVPQIIRPVLRVQPGHTALLARCRAQCAPWAGITI